MSKTLLPPQRMHLAMRTLRKVPEVTIYFWIIKLLTTAMGESTSDYLVYHINPYIAVALGSIGLIASLVLQFWSVDMWPGSTG